MPCFSTITTKMKDMQTLLKALTALGITPQRSGDTVTAVIDGQRTTFYLSNGVFQASGGNQAAVNKVTRKYSEVTIREFARKKGYTIQSSDGRKMVLVNRRG